MNSRWEYHEVEQLARSFDPILADAMPKVRAVVQKGALNIKTGAQSRVQGLAHAPAYPSAITYDTKEQGTTAEAEIGPDKNRRQGALGNIINYGSINNPPIPHIEPATDEELPRFEQALENLAVKAWEGR